MNDPEQSAATPAFDPSSPVLVHFYRAVVGHMDVWRQRMDATTNWATATTAAMVTFSFSAPESPHFMLLLAVGFDAMFLFVPPGYESAEEIVFRMHTHEDEE